MRPESRTAGESSYAILETYDPLVVRRPASWLLRDGWKIHGAISAREVPGRAS